MKEEMRFVQSGKILKDTATQPTTVRHEFRRPASVLGKEE